MKNLSAVAASAIAVLVFLTGCGGDAGMSAPGASVNAQALVNSQALTAQSDNAATPDETDAAAYCKQTGGLLERRRAVYGTNGPNSLPLAGVRNFCQYTASDGSRIHLLLTTLYTKSPTLAALAYILKPALGKGCTGNPASCYCSQLGGSDQFGGTNLAGGGWYLQNSIDQTLEACIFPDTSSIDSWGLAYHSNGIIRGADLTKLMRYQYKP